MRPLPEGSAPVVDTPVPVVCDHCGRPLGVYEPMIVAQRGRVRESSRAIEPRPPVLDTTCYHRACYSIL